MIDELNQLKKLRVSKAPLESWPKKEIVIFMNIAKKLLYNDLADNKLK